MRFRLRPGVDEEAFRAADKKLQTEFAYQQPGLRRRTAARSDEGEWIVVDLWTSAADSEACATRWESDAVVQELMAFVDPDTVVVASYEELGG